MLWKFNSVYNPRLQTRRSRSSRSATSSRLRRSREDVVDAKSIYIHPANGHRSLVLDEATQSFVDQTRMKAEPMV